MKFLALQSLVLGAKLKLLGEKVGGELMGEM